MKKKKYIYFLVPFVSLFFLYFFVSDSFANVPELPELPSGYDNKEFIAIYGEMNSNATYQGWMIAELTSTYACMIPNWDAFSEYALTLFFGSSYSECTIAAPLRWNGSSWITYDNYWSYPYLSYSTPSTDYDFEDSVFSTLPVIYRYPNAVDNVFNYNTVLTLDDQQQFMDSNYPPVDTTPCEYDDSILASSELCVPCSYNNEIIESNELCVEPVTVTELSVLQDINDNLVTIKAFCYALGVALALGLVLLVINKLVSYTIGQAF